MKINKLLSVASVLLMGAFTACETSEDISDAFDHEVPKCIVKTDSIVAKRGETISIVVDASDNVGLASVELVNGDWQLREVVKFENAPTSYTFQADVKVSPNAKIGPWSEDAYRNDGSMYKIQQYYSKLEFTAYDVNMNKFKKLVYVKVVAAP